MSFDLEGIERSKRALRQSLATRPIAEKLRMLDALRERALTLRGATLSAPTLVQEKPAHYKSKGK